MKQQKSLSYPVIGDQSNLHIQPMQEADVEAFLHWANDPEVQSSFIRKPRKFKKENIKKAINKMYSSNKPGNIYYSVYLGDKHIGRVKLQEINWETGSAYTSGVLTPDLNFRGKGYGTEATSLLIELAKKIGLSTLYGVIHEDNIANLRIYNRLSFKEVGKLSNYTMKDGQKVGALILEKHLYITL